MILELGKAHHLVLRVDDRLQRRLLVRAAGQALLLCGGVPARAGEERRQAVEPREQRFELLEQRLGAVVVESAAALAIASAVTIRRIILCSDAASAEAAI